MKDFMPLFFVSHEEMQKAEPLLLMCPGAWPHQCPWDRLAAQQAKLLRMLTRTLPGPGSAPVSPGLTGGVSPKNYHKLALKHNGTSKEVFLGFMRKAL